MSYDVRYKHNDPKYTRQGSGVVRVFLLNLLLKFRWTIPAWVLLILYFAAGWPLWCFWAALGLWLVVALAQTWLLSWANRCGNEPDAYKPNRNPYSHTNEEDFPTKRR